MRQYGLIGKPLTHSFSKAFFAQKFANAGLKDCRYDNFELERIELFPDLLRDHPGLCGLNVTIPYKKAVIPFLDQVNEVVRGTGACNCIKIENGRRSGFNTDVIGFRRSLGQVLQPHHNKALVLGTGGSSGAVQFALQQLGITFRLVSRTAGPGMMTYEDVDAAVLSEHTILINTTPVGMYPNMEATPPVPYHHLTRRHLLFDLIYNPEQTLFLKLGKERGAATCNGQRMLVEQAEESWTIWNS